jgi:hypothetical protein
MRPGDDRGIDGKENRRSTRRRKRRSDHAEMRKRRS